MRWCSHHRLSFCSVFFLEIRHAAMAMTTTLTTKATRYGSSAAHSFAE